MRDLYFNTGTAQAAARSGGLWRIQRALASARRHAADFTVLVPWPSLAASFQADVELLERALREKGGES